MRFFLVYPINHIYFESGKNSAFVIIIKICDNLRRYEFFIICIIFFLLLFSIIHSNSFLEQFFKLPSVCYLLHIAVEVVYYFPAILRQYFHFRFLPAIHCVRRFVPARITSPCLLHWVKRFTGWKRVWGERYMIELHDRALEHITILL